MIPRTTRILTGKNLNIWYFKSNVIECNFFNRTETGHALFLV